jgi:hypothetical protein
MDNSNANKIIADSAFAASAVVAETLENMHRQLGAIGNYSWNPYPQISDELKNAIVQGKAFYEALRVLSERKLK